MDSNGIAPANMAASTTNSSSEDPSKKVRKPYTITKSRESWTKPEHDKFLEALQLFDRDWKKIEAFIGTKTAIQIRSHAQKYFLKVQKNGTNEHVPPPRPKRKAAHKYPQKASKIDKVPSQSSGSVSLDQGHHSSPSILTTPTDGPPALTRPNITASTTRLPQTTKVKPDFAQVYRFLGSVFDPDASDQQQTLKKMDPVDVEAAVLLMRNLTINLASPEFENQRKLLSTSAKDSSKTSNRCKGK